MTEGEAKLFEWNEEAGRLHLSKVLNSSDDQRRASALQGPTMTRQDLRSISGRDTLGRGRFDENRTIGIDANPNFMGRAADGAVFGELLPASRGGLDEQFVRRAANSAGP